MLIIRQADEGYDRIGKHYVKSAMRLRVQRIKNISEEIMRVLIACEFSGIIRDAFLERGHNAISCDLLPTERPGPHYQGNVFDILYNGWDLLIAHPPCTHLAVSGDGNSMGMFDRSTDVAILKINKSNYKQINLNGMTNTSSRKNYDDIPAELTLREKVRTIREKALKLKFKSPDISKMIQVRVPRESAIYFVKNEKGVTRVKERIARNYPNQNVEIKVIYPKNK
mgnify:CR=1 FL=1